MSSQKTPLFSEHERLGGKIVDFAGWQMPVQFEGLRQEHDNVRNNVGLFDVSHMGEIRLKGERSLESLEWLTSNHAGKLENGQAQYTLLTNDQGGVVDDLIVYCLEKGQDYLLCVNAANKDKDLQWILKNNKGAEVVDESSQWGQIAIQGPKGVQLTQRVMGDAVTQIKGFHFAPVTFMGQTCYVARTGYTGEDGFEVFVPWGETTVSLWKQLLEQGQDLNVAPVGLGARDTLRTEMKFPLYGHELTDETNPYEAGLGWVVKPKAKDFLGKDKIVGKKEQGLEVKLVGFKMLERGIPRQGYTLFSFDNQEIGKVTSGTPSPSTGDNIGIGYIAMSHAELGSEIYVDIRGRKVKAEVVKTPFVNTKGA